MAPRADRHLASLAERGNFLANLQNAWQQLTDLAGAERKCVDKLLQGSSSSPVPKGRWQKGCSRLLRQPDEVALHRHLRRRLDRWSLPLLLGHRVERLQVVLRRLGPVVPPCVWAATIKAMMDGWISTDPQRAVLTLFSAPHTSTQNTNSRP